MKACCMVALLLLAGVVCMIPRGVSGLLVSPSLFRAAPYHQAFHHRSHSTQGTTLHSATTTTSSSRATTTTIPDLQAQLDAEGLGLCHGILHASGVRRLSDMQALTLWQIDNMGADNLDRRNIFRVIDNSTPSNSLLEEGLISTSIDGAFDNTGTDQQDFALEAISVEHNIFKGRIFTEEQCLQISRMAEYHAYRGMFTVGSGWTDQIYSLTAQHMQCKEVPDFLAATSHVFEQLRQELQSLFPGILPGSIVFENSGEPHLVKYNGKAKGTALHTDNPKCASITLNVVLSASDDYDGGGTYIEVLDKTIQLQQGEMLIHLGDLEHAGADITAGVRRLLICFFACEWEDEKLNKVNPALADA